MQIQVARLIAGTEKPAGDGVTGAARCVIRLPDSSLVAAVLKRGPIEEIFTECFCALLLRAWNLPVPDPYIVNEGAVISFASADTAYPNMKQQVGLLPNMPPRVQNVLINRAIDLVYSLRTTHLAIACDEAINNKDRNLGNVLWDGQSEAWIDHAFSLGQGSHQADANKLCAMAIDTRHEESAQRGGVANAMLLDRSQPFEADATLPSHMFSKMSAANFVVDRLNKLGNLVVNRFPSPADLFSEQDR